MWKHKIYAFLGMAVLSSAIVGFVNWQTSQAQQSTGPKPLIVADIESVNGMQTSNPLANYPNGNPSYSGQEIAYDNEGISIFIAPKDLATPVTTDINVPECGHLGIQSWQGANYAYKLTDANTWQKRKSTCPGMVIIGSSGQIRAQTLTIKGASVQGKPFTLQVNVPDYTLWDKEVGGGSRRLYVDDTGATYGCYDPTGSFTRAWPNECQFSPSQALARSPVGPSPTNGPVSGNGLCQAGETPLLAPNDCPANLSFNLTKISSTGTVELPSTGTSTASMRFTLQNAGNADAEFPVYCDAGFAGFMGHMYYLNPDLTLGQKFNTAVDPTSLPSGLVTLAPGASKSFEFKFDVNSGGVGTWNVKCYTQPINTQTHEIFYTMKQEITDPLIVKAFTPAPDTNLAKATLTQLFPGQYSNTKFNIKIEDLDSIKEFSVKKLNGTFVFGGSPGVRGIIGECGGASPVKNIDSGTVTLESADFPLSASVTDCRSGAAAYAFSVPALGVTPPPPSDSSLIAWWKFDGNGNNEIPASPSATIFGKAVFNSSGGKLGGYAYIPGVNDYLKIPYNKIFDLPDAFTIEFWFRQRSDQPFFQDLVYKGTTPNTYNFRVFRQLWNQYNFGPIIVGYTAVNTGYWSQTSNPNQLAHNVWHHVAYTRNPSQAAYYLDGEQIHVLDLTTSGNAKDYGGPVKTPPVDIIVGDSAVDTDIDNLRIYNRSLTKDEVLQNGGFPKTEPPRECGNGEKCSKGSWCNSGLKCFYPDSAVTCTPWIQSSSPGPMQTSCASGTSVCDPSDANCVAPGQTVPYSSGKWCSNSQSYYSTDGKSITCVNYGSAAPAGYSACKPDDKNCIPEDSYGPTTGYCMNSMKCYQKTADNNASNDVYCKKMPTPTGSMMPEPVECPAGYSQCSPTDTSCKAVGDKWSDSNTSYYCSGGQKCNLSTGGGLCVKWNESCPSGTKYCGVNETNCVEPGEYKTLSTSSTAGNNYWCGGGSGMVFYSSLKAYCEKKERTSTMDSAMGMMWTAAEVKAVLAKLGSGWGLCAPGATNCIEPGKTGPSEGWCAWYPSNNGSTMSIAPSMPLRPGLTRTCPALDDIVVPPPPDDYEKKHAGCDMTVYRKNAAGIMVDEKGVSAPIPASKPGYITDFKFVDDHYHLCSTKIGEPPVCGMAITRAYNPSTKECKDFSTTCIPDGWVTKQCEIEEKPPIEPECRPGITPGLCMVPEYRWNIADKKWEKCDFKNKPPYIDVKGNKKATHTNCTSIMYFDIEKEWRTEQYLVHPPETDGEWYWPPWDASAKSVQYDPATDKFGECIPQPMPMVATAVRPGDGYRYYAPCMSIPEIDRGWMLKKFRAEYKIYLMSRERDPDQPVLPPPPPPEPPQIPPSQCKAYLIGIRQGISGNKQFWKDIHSQLAASPENYPDRKILEDLLGKAKVLIAELEKLTKFNKCDKIMLSKIQERQNTLNQEIFAELSSYLPDLQDSVQFSQCRDSLGVEAKELRSLAKKAKNAEAGKLAADLAAAIDKKLEELDAAVSAGDYSVGFECQEFSRDIESQTASLKIESDDDINEIIEDVVEAKLAPVIDKLTAVLEERGKKIDELLVKVAELHQAIDQVSQSATQISEKIAVSYTALTRIEDTFAEQKLQIQAAKDRLIPLIEKAIGEMRESRCVRGADQERLVSEFGNVATINWIGDRADDLEKKIGLFIESCSAKSVATDWVSTFVSTSSNLATQNQEASHETGLTPFKDVPTHEWYYGGMMCGYKTGFVTQGRPAENVLRQDALLMVLRVAGLKDEDIVGDCSVGANVTDVSPYARCAVAKAQEKGLELRGSMTSSIQRGEVALWISKLIPGLKDADESALEGYTDLAGVPGDWLKAISKVVVNEVMVGQVTADKKIFQPKDLFTRAALSVTLDKLLNFTTESPKC